MLCDNCKSVVDENARFCENCGKEVLKNDYPTVTLVSSGPMKYRKTNLDIARLDLESVRIDLNKEYSSYVIPVGNPFVKEDSHLQKSDGNIRKLQQKTVNQVQMPVLTEPLSKPYNPHPAHKVNPYDRVNRSSINDKAYDEWLNSRNVRNVANPQNYNNHNNAAPEKSGALELFISFVAMMFMSLPVASLIVSIIALCNIARLDKGAKLKTFAAAVAGFVAIISVLMIFVAVIAAENR